MTLNGHFALNSVLRQYAYKLTATGLERVSGIIVQQASYRPIVFVVSTDKGAFICID